MPCVPRQSTQQAGQHVIVKRRQQIRRAGTAGILALGAGSVKNHILSAGHRPHRIDKATAVLKEGTGQGHIPFVALKSCQPVNQCSKAVLRQPVPGVAVQGQHFKRRYGYGLPAALVAPGVAGNNTPVTFCGFFHAQINDGKRVQQQVHTGIAALKMGICMPEKPSLSGPHQGHGLHPQTVLVRHSPYPFPYGGAAEDFFRHLPQALLRMHPWNLPPHF